MDQFPHDDWLKHMDRPRAPARDIHASAKFVAGLPVIKVSWSPINMRGMEALDCTQAIALMAELAYAVQAIERTAASHELVETMAQAVKDWEAHND